METSELVEKINIYLNIFIEQKINLEQYALKNNIPILIKGNMDKGWKGNVVEHILNLQKNNKKGSDFNDLEIKTVPVLKKDGILKIKETTCLSVLSTDELIKKEFQNSSLYKKINKTLFIFINVTEENNPIIENTYFLDLEYNSKLRNEMKEDYDIIVSHIFDNIENEMPLDYNFTGKLGNVIQPRPKTGRKGSYTWAFYLKTFVLQNLLEEKINIKEKIKF